MNEREQSIRQKKGGEKLGVVRKEGRMGSIKTERWQNIGDEALRKLAGVC